MEGAPGHHHRQDKMSSPVPRGVSGSGVVVGAKTKPTAGTVGEGPSLNALQCRLPRAGSWSANWGGGSDIFHPEPSGVPPHSGCQVV